MSYAWKRRTIFWARWSGLIPFPRIVRDFQSVIGRETIEQSREQIGRLPDIVVACVGGGSNAAGMFFPFIEHSEVELVGVEAGGRSCEPGEHASPLCTALRACCMAAIATSCKTRMAKPAMCIRSRQGSTIQALAPNIATGKIPVASATRAVEMTEALEAFGLMARSEGILPPLELACGCQGD